MLTFPRIDPVALAIGPLNIRWYGLMYLLGFAAAWLLGRARAKASAASGGPVWSTAEIDDLITYSVIGLILGARLGYALFYDLPFYLEHPSEVFKIWRGGMSFHGGALGLAFTLWLFGRKTGRTLFQVSDYLVPLAPPGLFAGRIGNFINGELWGRPTTGPWGMVFPEPEAGPYPRHPSQLYEAFLEGLVLFVVMWIYTRKPRPTMAPSGLFLLLYGIFRFTVEFAREPDAQLGFIAFGWLTMGQLLCLPMVLFGAFLLYLALTRETREARARG